jgi:tetratricopeptide (TPR) repeat protein
MLPILILATISIVAGQSPTLPADYPEKLAALEKAREVHPNDLQNLDALAGSYSMGAEYRKAIEVLQQMQTLNREDHALSLRVARNYAWAGDSRRAIAEYKTYLAAVPEDRQATIELIQLHRFRGDYPEAEELCNRLLAIHSDDAEVLALKAEVLHWARDRRLLARRTADRAAAIAPADPEARVSQVYASMDLGENRRAVSEFTALKNLVESQGGPTPAATWRDAYKLLESSLLNPIAFSSMPGFSTYNDSDGIHNTFAGLSLERSIAAEHKLLMDVGVYEASAPQGSIFTATHGQAWLNNFRAGGQVRLAPAVYMTLLGGGSYRASDGSLRPVYNFDLSASPIDRWTFHLSSGREFLGVTPRAIDRGISSTTVGGAIQFALNPRTFLSIGTDRGYWSDANQSIRSEATLKRVLHYNRHISVDAGLLHHWEEFDRNTQLEAGFFTPDRYWRHDGYMGVRGELKRVQYELRGSGGSQQVAHGADYRPDWDITSAVSVRLSRLLRLWLSYQRRNYSLVSKDGWYQGLHFSLEVQR